MEIVCQGRNCLQIFYKKCFIISRYYASKPRASEVLSCYLSQEQEPMWTSYFVKSRDVINDQYGMSHFNWLVGGSNYHVLRVGCWPYIKYHCSKRPWQDLSLEDTFFRFIKVANFGIPCLMYGMAAILLIKHQEMVATDHGTVPIYFLIPETKGSAH